MNGGGSERGRHRIWNRLQALSCQHRARRGARAHGPRDHDLSRSQPPNRLSHPGAPLPIFKNGLFLYCGVFILLKFFFLNVYLLLRDRERQSMSIGGAERQEGDTESKAGSRLRAVSTEPDTGFKLTDCEIMTWAEFSRPTDCATHAPPVHLIF